MENAIRIYRKASKTATRKPGKAKAESVRNLVALKCRVQRPGLLDHLLSDFYSQPTMAPSVIDNKVDRILNHHSAGWTVPADSLGRKGSVDASTAQSILLWIKQNVPTVDASEVSVVVEPVKVPKV